jgi:hypothetical protein
VWSRNGKAETAEPKCPASQKPILEIELKNNVLDVLHALLRITDRLEEKLFFEMFDRDDEHNFGETKKGRENIHLNKPCPSSMILTSVLQCGKSSLLQAMSCQLMNRLTLLATKK